jgi:uncharacterized protein YjbI with pentapeptide repeats
VLSLRRLLQEKTDTLANPKGPLQSPFGFASSINVRMSRERTITILFQLDARHISYVFTFLREAGLILTTSNDTVVNLNHADLRTVSWSHADLSGAYLYNANLSGADLFRAKLRNAHLSNADLSGVVNITIEKLEKQAKSLKGATMPDESIHP